MKLEKKSNREFIKKKKSTTFVSERTKITSDVHLLCMKDGVWQGDTQGRKKKRCSGFETLNLWTSLALVQQSFHLLILILISQAKQFLEKDVAFVIGKNCFYLLGFAGQGKRIFG